MSRSYGTEWGQLSPEDRKRLKAERDRAEEQRPYIVNVALADGATPDPDGSIVIDVWMSDGRFGSMVLSPEDVDF